MQLHVERCYKALMLDLVPVPWIAALAVVTAVLWVVLREARAFRDGRGRNVRDVLDIALPVLAIAMLAHGLFLQPDRREEQLVNEEPAPPESREMQQGPFLDESAAAFSSAENLTLASTANPNTQSLSDAALIAGALAAFQDATASNTSSVLAVQTSAASAPGPAPPVAVVSQTTPSVPAGTQQAADRKVVTVVPLETRNGSGTRGDGTGVILSSDGTGVVVAKRGPVVVIQHYENPAFRSLRSCPDESCEIVANLSRYAPLTRTGKRHPQGIAQRAWVEVRSSGPHCKRYDTSSMVGACLEWQRSPVTGWTLDPNLLR